MQFHYALVDELISREEFERRIEAKMQECGDLIDDVTAPDLADIRSLYADLRYGPRPKDTDLRRLKHAVNRLRT